MTLNPKANTFSPKQDAAPNSAFNTLYRDFGPFGPLHLTPEDQQAKKGGKIFVSHPSDPQVEIIFPQATTEQTPTQKSQENIKPRYEHFGRKKPAPPSTPDQNAPNQSPAEDNFVPNSTLKVLTMNVNSIVSDKKRTLARNDIAKTGADIVILTETRLGEEDSEFIVPGYYLIHHEVRKENAGGVMALAKDQIHAHSESGVSLGIKKEIQVIQFVVNDITFFGVYRSPTVKIIGPVIDHHRALRDHLNKEIDKLADYPFVIIGDMNLWELAECNFDPSLKPISDDQIETIDHIWAEFV